MARPKKTGNSTAEVAAAAAAAAVKASQKGNVVEFVLPADDDDDEELESSLTDDVLDDLEKIDEHHGGGITWELFCDAPLDRSGQIGKLTRTELRGLRDRCLEFGPGEYHVVARAVNGRFVPKTRRNIKISGLARGPVTPAPASAAAMDPMTLMNLFEERAEKRRIAAAKERWDTIKFFAPILAPIGVEMAKGLFGGRGGGESIKDMVAAMVGLKELNGSPSEKAIEMFMKGMELAQTLAPEGSGKGATWPDMVTGALREMRPVLESIASRRPATPAPTAPATPQLQFAPTPQGTAPGGAVSPTPAAPAGSSPPADGPEVEMLRMFEPLLRKLANELEEFAVNNAEPGLAAEALLAKIPRMARSQISPEQLEGWLSDPRWWEILSAFQTSLTPYQAYCDQVREELLLFIKQQPGDDAASEQEPT